MMLPSLEARESIDRHRAADTQPRHHLPRLCPLPPASLCRML